VVAPQGDPWDGDDVRQTLAPLMHGASDALYEVAMIAATVRVHKLTVVTRNVADFKQFKVQVPNPFQTVRE